MKIVLMSQLNETQIEKAISIYIEGFYHILKLMSKDKAKLISFHKACIMKDMVYVCLYDDEAVGILALETFGKSPVKIKKEVCVEHFGKLKGSIAANQMKSAMVKPKVKDKDSAHIEFIAADPNLRGKGIGSAMIKYMRDNLNYKYLTLEVLTKNPRARRLYERLGFVKVRSYFNAGAFFAGFGIPEFMRLDCKASEPKETAHVR